MVVVPIFSIFGCGVGHGCYTLSEIPGVEVVGIDFSSESLEYAKRNYARPNISYHLGDLQAFIPNMPEYDYVVSRGVIEHIPNGLQVAQSIKWLNRLLFDVPYDEPEGNPHHLLLGIREEDFSEFPEAELFFEDMEGVIYDVINKSKKPNMIMCVCSRTGLPKVKDIEINFPLPAWVPEGNEYRQLLNQNKIQVLEQRHEALQQEYQRLQNEHQLLQQSRAVLIARKLREYPFLMKLTSVIYGYLSKIYHWFGGR